MNRIKDLMIQGMEALQNSDSPRLDTELLIGHVLQVDRLYLHLHLEEEIPDEKASFIRKLLQKRAQSYPLHYILGQREFMGMDFIVKEGVLIPRPDTEILTETVSALINPVKKTNGLEIGTGSGIISITLLKHHQKLLMEGVDINPLAIALTTENAIKHQVKDRLHLIQGNLFDKVDGIYDFIVSNPPYIPAGDMEILQVEVREYEPLSALVGEEDGLIFYRDILKQGPSHVRSNGFIAFETGWNQGDDIMSLMHDAKLTQVKKIKDLAGLDRVVVGFIP